MTTATDALRIPVGLAEEDWTGDARFFEYHQAVDPLRTGTITPVPVETFSAAPALVFARLYANARNHLRKLRGEKLGQSVALDKQLTEVTTLLPATPPLGQLSLQNQGLFALGYYHEGDVPLAAFRSIDKQVEQCEVQGTPD